MRTGLLLLPSRPATELVDLAVGAERLGYDDFWLADERFFREVYTVLGLAAARTSRLRLGPGVTDPYSRHPALTAMAIATLDEVSAGRAILGLGAGVSGFRELGVDAARSAVAIREAVTLIRGLLAGQTVTLKGEQVSFVDGRLDVRAPRQTYRSTSRPSATPAVAWPGGLPTAPIMQGCVAEPLVRFFKERVAEGASRPDGRGRRSWWRGSTCASPTTWCGARRHAPTIVRSLLAPTARLFTFTAPGWRCPPTLREAVLRLSTRTTRRRCAGAAGPRRLRRGARRGAGRRRGGRRLARRRRHVPRARAAHGVSGGAARGHREYDRTVSDRRHAAGAARSREELTDAGALRDHDAEAGREARGLRAVAARIRLSGGEDAAVDRELSHPPHRGRSPAPSRPDGHIERIEVRDKEQYARIRLAGRPGRSGSSTTYLERPKNSSSGPSPSNRDA